MPSAFWEHRLVGPVEPWSARSALVAGARLASLSWQSLLAGALVRRHPSPKFRLGMSILVSLVIIAFGIRVLLSR